MAHTMDPFAVHESYHVPNMDVLAVHDLVPAEDDFGWLALEKVIDNWAGWFTPVSTDHTDAAASDTSRPTPPSLPPSQPAPFLLLVAPIAEDGVDLSGLTPPAAPAAAYPSSIPRARARSAFAPGSGR